MKTIYEIKNILFKKTLNFYSIEHTDINSKYSTKLNNNTILTKHKYINTDLSIINTNNNDIIFNKLVNLCMRRGNKKLAYKNVKKSFVLIRNFFWINPILILKMAILQSEPFIKLDRYMLGKREKIIPRFIKINKRMDYVLNSIVNTAIKNKDSYKNFYITLVHALIEYCVPHNVLIIKNKEENELADLNKFLLYNKRSKKRRRKVRMLRKIKDWVE